MEICFVVCPSVLTRVLCLQRALRVDTGDFELDQILFGYMKVVVGYLEGVVVKVKC